MLDIGFSEILVIALIGLIFIGPERLPETVRTISLYIGRFKRGLRDTRREIEQQLGADDIRRELHNEEVMRSLEKLRQDVKENIDETLKLDEEEDFYPPGHHDHDPNNDIDDDIPEPWPTESKNTIDNKADTKTVNNTIDNTSPDANKPSAIEESKDSVQEQETINKSPDSTQSLDQSASNKSA